MKTKYPEFAPPEGFALPEGVTPGEEFEALATLKQKEDGTLCLVAVDGMPVSVSETPAQEESTPDDDMGLGEALYARSQMEA